MLIFSLCVAHAVAVHADLSLDTAVANARAHHPLVRQAQARINTADAAADVVRGPLLPTVNGTANASFSTANYAPKPGAVPRDVQAIEANQGKAYPFLGLSLNATQVLTDFGETWNAWHAAQTTARAQRAASADILAQVLLAVRKAFFDARSKRALWQVAKDTLDNQAKHRDQIETYVAVGKRPEIDVVQARTDYASARFKMISAENDYLSAKATLNQAMGLEAGDTQYDVADDTLPVQPGEDGALAVLLAEALQNRADYQAADTTVQASDLSLTSAYRAYFPQLSVQGSLTDQGQSPAALAWNWSVGAQLQVPIFQGYVLQANVDQAAANLSADTAGRDNVRAQVRLDVEQARLGVRGAKEEGLAADESLSNAKQLLALAEGRYAAGVGNIIELGDAQVALTTAAGQQVQAEFDLATARATLLRALGRE